MVNSSLLIIIGLAIGFLGAMRVVPHLNLRPTVPPTSAPAMNPQATPPPHPAPEKSLNKIGKNAGEELGEKVTVIGPTKPGTSTDAPGLGEEGSAAADAELAKLNIFDLRTRCERAERSWMARHFDEYAPKSRDAAEQKVFADRLFGLLREQLKTGSWWRGEVELPNGDHSSRIDVMLKIYGARETDLGDPFKARGASKVNTGEDLCFALSPFVTTAGRVDNQSFTGCGGPQRKRGDTYYMVYNTIGDEKLSAAITAILLPFPIKGAGPLEYLSTTTGQWISMTQFAWRASSYEEWQELHDHFIQALGH